MHSGLGGAYHPGNAVAEAMEDMAQLERLVGRLAGVPQAVPQVAHPVPQGGWAPTTPGTAPQHLYTVPGMPYQQIYTVPWWPRTTRRPWPPRWWAA